MILDVPTGLLVTAIGGFASAIGSNLVLFFRHATYVTTRLEIHDLSIAEMKQDVERVEFAPKPWRASCSLNWPTSKTGFRPARRTPENGLPPSKRC